MNPTQRSADDTARAAIERPVAASAAETVSGSVVEGAAVADTRGFRGQLYNGFGEGLAQAFEFAVTPLLFGGIGFLLDGWLGIRPVLTIVLAVFAVVGMFVRMWYGYDREMRAHEAKGQWGRST